MAASAGSAVEPPMTRLRAHSTCARPTSTPASCVALSTCLTSIGERPSFVSSFSSAASSSFCAAASSFFIEPSCPFFTAISLLKSYQPLAATTHSHRWRQSSRATRQRHVL